MNLILLYIMYCIAHCAVSRALLVDRWAVRRVNGRVGCGTVRHGYLRTLQTFVDILHSFRFIPFRLVSFLFYFITPKPNKRIKQNKSFSTFCIVPPFCRLHCLASEWHRFEASKSLDRESETWYGISL